MMRILVASFMLIIYLNLGLAQHLKMISIQNRDQCRYRLGIAQFLIPFNFAGNQHQNKKSGKLKSIFSFDSNIYFIGNNVASKTEPEKIAIKFHQPTIKNKSSDNAELKLTGNDPNDFLVTNKDITVKSLYPNPARDEAFIEFSIINKNVSATILIHNVLGSMIEKYQLLADGNMIKITTENYKPGIYFYTLDVDNKHVITKKFVIKK